MGEPFRVLTEAKKFASLGSSKKSAFADLFVDFDFVFINQMVTELQYLEWILKGNY